MRKTSQSITGTIFLTTCLIIFYWIVRMTPGLRRPLSSLLIGSVHSWRSLPPRTSLASWNIWELLTETNDIEYQTFCFASLVCHSKKIFCFLLQPFDFCSETTAVLCHVDVSWRWKSGVPSIKDNFYWASGIQLADQLGYGFFKTKSHEASAKVSASDL